MSRPGPSILILRAGHTSPEVVRRHGDYDRWFTDRMEGLGCRFTVHHVPEAGVADDSGYDGVLITGTTASVVKPEPWMEPLGKYLTRPDGSGPPVLAVCFGAQLAAAALGGRVVRNPLGWEIGTIEVDLNAAGRADPLFEGLPSRIAVQSTHEDVIDGLPDPAALLAGNRMSEVQAFALGRRLRAVQFHPEASGGIIRTLIGLRRGALEHEARALRGEDDAAARRSVQRLESSVRDTEEGRRILENWVRGCVRKRASS